MSALLLAQTATPTAEAATNAATGVSLGGLLTALVLVVAISLVQIALNWRRGPREIIPQDDDPTN